MKKLLLALLVLIFSHSSYADSVAPSSFATMLKKVKPAVVNIRTIMMPSLAPPPTNKKNSEDDQQNPPQQKMGSIGSGVIVDANKGYIITNAHVIEDAANVTITLGDGRHFTAKIIGADKPSDIALLQIKAKNLSELPLADSNNLQEGDWVVAIGNPFGLSQTSTAGIISGLGRTMLGIENFENFIQISAPINPGNSGGALVTADGKLIGINTATVPAIYGAGIGFSIPSDMAKSVMAQLIEYGNVHRGALGVGIQDITPELATAFELKIQKGAVITQVMSDSPAEKAGAKVGDVVVSINGSPIKNANDVVNGIAFMRVDSKATLNVLRDNKPITLTAEITDPEKRKEWLEHKDPFFYGTTFKNFSLTSPIHGDIKGILVVDVEQDSHAWSSDLRAGDVIVSADRQKVSTIAELNKITAKAKDTLLLNVLRGAGAVFLLINRES